ncbi:S26 family signal peptidase [Streptosporangium sp. NPDC023825]|uniref:S26 family signal peptidase n=1 Tax=Streptosporangium sp. NPDC023825 TaxID=3154909 RepID=UPI003444AF90
MTAPLALILTPLAAGAAAVFWARRNLLVVIISGASMHPTHRPGDKVLVRRLPAGRIRAGDIVVADIVAVPEYVAAPSYGGIRHAARPGAAGTGRRRGAVPPWKSSPGPAPGRVAERVAFAPSRVVKRVAAVQGDPVPASVPRRAGETSVPGGCLVLLGDNPGQSLDSRHFGYVSATDVVGKVVGALSATGGR